MINESSAQLGMILKHIEEVILLPKYSSYIQRIFGRRFSSMQVYIFHTHPKAGFKTVHIMYVCNIEFETWRTRISPHYSPKGASFPVSYHMNE